MARVDQLRKGFNKTVYRRFSDKAQKSNARIEGRYRLGFADSVSQTVNNFFADLHKFSKTLRSERVCKLTGVKDTQMMATAVSVYEGMC